MPPFLALQTALAVCLLTAAPEPVRADGPTTLQQVFDAAWARQPEARSLDSQLTAAAARQRIAGRWIAGPPALELSARTDHGFDNGGTREYEAALALPLWLPDERARAGALAEAETRTLASRAGHARLRIAATVREAWWSWHRARHAHQLARARLDHTRLLAHDVARRYAAGELARADHFQAEGAVAAAEAALAGADAERIHAGWQLAALTGGHPADAATATPEPVPPSARAAASVHPAVAELQDRLHAARQAEALAAVQTRDAPELRLATTRERDVYDAAYQQSLTLGLRLPFAAGERGRARLAQAHADAIELESRLRIERARLDAAVETATAQLDAARARLAASERRAQLARDTRGFFDKAFRLGETDLPTRLRIEFEAGEAERQAGEARIGLAEALSAQRQALGLLPE